MRLLLLNQYAPPDQPPTARLLGELADHLRQHGHTVEILSQSQSYQGRPAWGGGRLRRELAALLHILRAGWRGRTPRLDVVLTLSSPPGLLVVGMLLAWRHRARLAHWAMDLYPELAVVLGEIPAGFAAGIVQTTMNFAYRQAELVVALDEDMQAHLQPRCRVPVRVLEPWPSAMIEDQLAAPTLRQPTTRNPAAPWTWLYSGNLGRAHEWQTLLDAQRLLEERTLPIHLVFQGDGAARHPAQAYAQQHGLRRCEWKDYVPEHALVPELTRAQLLIVTQRPETRGLLWPSKLALLERLPVPVLYVGSPDGAIARRLRQRDRTGVFAPGQAREAADWIEALYRQPLSTHAPGKSITPLDAAASCALLEQWLSENSQTL